MDKRRPSKLIPVPRDSKSSKKMGRGWECVYGSRKEWPGKCTRIKESDKGAMRTRIKGSNCKS